jgi:hypothetical protein
MGLYNELEVDGPQSLTQLMELVLAENNPKMRYRHVILVYMVAVLLRHERSPHFAYSQFMTEQTISDVIGSSALLPTSHHLCVELA